MWAKGWKEGRVLNILNIVYSNEVAQAISKDILARRKASGVEITSAVVSGAKAATGKIPVYALFEEDGESDGSLYTSRNYDRGARSHGPNSSRRWERLKATRKGR